MLGRGVFAFCVFLGSAFLIYLTISLGKDLKRKYGINFLRPKNDVLHSEDVELFFALAIASMMFFLIIFIVLFY